MIQRYIGAGGMRAVPFFFMVWLAGAAGFTPVRAEPVAATYTGPGSDFGTAANWGGVAPGPAQDLLVDQNATLVVSGSQQARNLDVIAGSTGITLNTGSALILNSLENGTLSVGTGAVLGVTGAGTLQVAVIEAGGALNLATTTILDGGANPNPSRDGYSPSAVTRYGLVVLGGGTATLQSGANVTLAQPGKAVGVRIGEGAGTGTLAVQAGSNLTVGTATDRGFFVVGDFGSNGVVNQTGGTVSVVGAVNVGSQGGSGTYNLSGGTFNVGLFEDGSDSNGFSVGARRTGSNTAPNGTLNISGTGELILTRGYLLVGGDTSPTSGGAGVVNQTGGLVRIIKDGLALGSGASGTANGTYNLNGGVLELGGTNGIQGGGSGGGSSTFNFGGGTLRVIERNLTTSVALTLVDGTTSTIDTAGLNATFSALGGTGAFLKTGEGTMTLSGTANIGKVAAGTGVPTVSTVEEGTLAITGTTTVLGVLAANGSEAVFDTPSTAVISLANGGSLMIGNGTSPGSYLLVGYGGGKTGAFSMTGGLLTVAGVASAPFPGSGIAIGDQGGSGRFTMTGGTINLKDAGKSTNLAVGTSGGTGVFTQSGGTVNLGSNFSVGAGQGSEGTYSVSGSAILNASGPTIVYIGDNGGSGTLEIGGSAEVNFGAGSSLWVGGINSAANSGSSGTITQTGGTVNFGGNYFQLGGKTGDTGTYNLNGGTLAIGGTNAIRSGNGTANFNLGGGTVKVSGSALTTSIGMALKTGTVSTINTNSLGATFSGSFTGAGGMTKTGAGVLRFTGTSDYSGATLIANGTFRVDGVLSATTITVESGATLAGHGTVAHVNILNGGRVDLGDTTGVLNATGNFSLGDTSHLLLKIASAADYDKITIGGGLTAGGTFEVVFINGFNPLVEASFSLLVAQTHGGGFDTLVLPDLAEGLEWNTSALNSSGVLSIVGTAVPEPESWAVLAGVAALALAVGRRRSASRRSS